MEFSLVLEADFCFNCCCLEIPSDIRVRYVPRCVYYHAQIFRRRCDVFSVRYGLYLRVPYVSHNKQRLFPQTALTGLGSVAET
jgi:hypothetical protein